MTLCKQCYGTGWHPRPHSICSACEGSSEETEGENDDAETRGP